jgi:hypothetical protein
MEWLSYMYRRGKQINAFKGSRHLSETIPSLVQHSPIRYVGPERQSDAEGVFITYYENAVPLAIERELDRLYENVFSSLAHFRAYGGLTADTCTYIARDGDETVAIFLFRRLHDTVLVLNEGMQVDDKAANDFARYVFSTWPDIRVIAFQAIRAGIGRLDYPFQRYECTAQVTMPLPSSEAAYLDDLGKNMRRNIRRYLKRLVQDHPSFRFDVYGPDEVRDEHLRTIFQLSRTRINGMNRQFALDEEEEKVFDLCRLSGMVGVATIDGQVCGGMIGFRTGDTYFAKVLGHDADYRDYSLGILCCYLMIAQCIERGCREFNFMWNEYPYKAALGGKRLSLARLVIYRSQMQRLRHIRFAAKVMLHGWKFRVASLLDKEDMQEMLSPMEKGALQTLLWMRKCHRAIRGKTSTQAG